MKGKDRNRFLFENAEIQTDMFTNCCMWMWA